MLVQQTDINSNPQSVRYSPLKHRILVETELRSRFWCRPSVPETFVREFLSL